MDLLKKNILDLEYQKYLQYFTTTIVAMFTFAIGIIIAIFTRQLTSLEMIILALIVSLLGYTFLVWLLLRFKERMDTIKRELSQLER